MGKKSKRKSQDKISLVNSDSDLADEGKSFRDEDDLLMESEKMGEKSLIKSLKSRKRKRVRDDDESYSAFALDDSDSDSDSNLPTLKKMKKKKKNRVEEEEEEIYGDDEEDYDSDLEDDRLESQSDEMRTWGKKKKNFYGGNLNEYKEIVDDENEINEDETEEKESKFLQMKQMEELDEDDFMDAFSKSTKSKSAKIDKDSSIKLDVSKLSTKERLQLFKQESPEFFGITSDFEDKMTEAIHILNPFIKLMDNGKVPSTGVAATFIRMKYDLILNYCVNISCYLMFKSKRISLKHHPLSGRLVQYKTLLDADLKPLSDKIIPEIKHILEQVNSGKSIKSLIKKEKSKHDVKEKNKLSTKKRLNILKKNVEIDAVFSNKNDNELTFEENQAIQMYESAFKKNQLENESETDDEDEKPQVPLEENEGKEGEEEEDQRRSINYQIAKNKGLTPKRSKVQRNPRVKHRQKFEKAKVRRKGQVRQVRKETKKYGGELFGINARVKKGIKLQ